MRILLFERLEQTAAYGAAVLVVGLREHYDELGYGAAGNNVTLTQIVYKNILQIVHYAVKAAAGERFMILTVDREKSDMYNLAAAHDGTCLQLVEHFEEIVLAEHSAARAEGFLELIPHFRARNGFLARFVACLTVEAAAFFGGHHAKGGEEHFAHFILYNNTHNPGNFQYDERESAFVKPNTMIY